MQEPNRKLLTSPHRTFQEYLAATGIMRNKSEPAIELRNRVYQNPLWWREVFWLAAGSARNITSVIYHLLDVLLPNAPGETELTNEIATYAGIAATAMWETKFIERVGSEKQYGKLHKRVQDWLLAAMTSDNILSPKERVMIGNVLNIVRDPRFDPDNYYLPAEDEMGFVLVEAGEFLMGSSEQEVAALVKEEPRWEKEFESELPQHRVVMSEYWIARYPVTVAQYWAFAKETGWKLDNEWRKYNTFPNHPVVKVDWNDANAYCEWLTEKLKERKCQVFLPTEAQWEKLHEGKEVSKNISGEMILFRQIKPITHTTSGTPAPLAVFPPEQVKTA